MKYIKLREKSSEEVEAQQLQYEAESNQLQLQADLLETQRAVKQAEQDLLNLKSAVVLDAQAILNKIDEVAGLKKGAETIKELIKELFE